MTLTALCPCKNRMPDDMEACVSHWSALRSQQPGCVLSTVALHKQMPRERSSVCIPGIRSSLQDVGFINIAQGVGRLILSLACAGLGGAASLDLCMAHFSIELTRLLGALLTSPEGASLLDASAR